MNENIIIVRDELRKNVFVAKDLNSIFISTEDVIALAKDIKDFFVSKLEALVDYFKSSINSLSYIQYDRLTVDAKTLYKLRNKVRIIDDKYMYNEIARIEVPALLGLRVNLLDAVETLIAIDGNVITNTISYLDETIVIVSKLLNSESYRKSTKPYKVNKIDVEILKELDKSAEHIVSKKVLEDRQPIRKLIPNITSLNYVTDTLLDLSDKANSKYIKSLNKKVKELTSTSEDLYKAINNDPAMLFARARLEELTTRLEHSANLVTATGVYLGILGGLVNTDINILNRLMKMK